MNHPSILFLNCGSICYDSTSVFEAHINHELEKAGWHTEHISVDKKNSVQGLKPLYGKHYDIIFDINTILPAASDENGVLCLNQIDGQIWHYILDHPLYHHDALKSPLKNYNVLCLDEAHAAFIKKYYPHIQKVIVLPLAASSAKKLIPYDERSNAIIFTGTYTNPDLLLLQAHQQPQELFSLFQNMVQMLTDHPQMTQEEAVLQLLPSHTDQLPAILQLNFLADCYLQACIREELLKQFLLQELPVTVYGHGWEDFFEKYLPKIPDLRKHLHLLGEYRYDQMPEIYADAKIALNQTPWFKSGMHDRVPLALLNGCVCLTEQCAYMEERLANAKELYYFSLEDMEQAAQLAKHLLQHPTDAAATAARGLAYAQKHFCWEHWVKEMCRFTAVSS